MEKKWIFESFKEWWSFTRNGFAKFGLGLAKIVASVVLGIASVMVWLWRKCVSLVGKYPNIALGTFIVITCIVWLLTFVKMRSRAVGAESQRDQIAWQYKQFKTSHGYE